MPGTVNVFNMARSLDVSPSFSPFTGVRLWYDDETYYFAGDETGRVLEADMPWATQEMAESILASVSGYEYQPFTAQTAIIDPLAELGDGVSVGGVYGPLAIINADFGSMFSAEIGAPQDEEIDHEYPYLSGHERKFNRQIAQTRSLITKTADSIQLEVKALSEELEWSHTSLKLNDEKIELAVSGKIGEEEANSLISQAMDSIELSVSSSEGSTTLKLTGGGVELSSDTVELSVKAVNINGQLNVDQLNIDGAITFDHLSPKVTNAMGDGLTEDDVTTLITGELVSSPNIQGANYWSEDKNTWMNLLSASETSTGIGGGIEVEASGVTLFSVIRDAYLSATLTAYNTDFLQVTSTGKIYPLGSWDFQFADVSGLDGVGGGDVTVTPVWG